MKGEISLTVENKATFWANELFPSQPLASKCDLGYRSGSEINAFVFLIHLSPLLPQSTDSPFGFVHISGEKGAGSTPSHFGTGTLEIHLPSFDSL
jgi:hypothetical protein